MLQNYLPFLFLQEWSILFLQREINTLLGMIDNVASFQVAYSIMCHKWCIYKLKTELHLKYIFKLCGRKWRLELRVYFWKLSSRCVLNVRVLFYYFVGAKNVSKNIYVSLSRSCESLHLQGNNSSWGSELTCLCTQRILSKSSQLPVHHIVYISSSLANKCNWKYDTLPYNMLLLVTFNATSLFEWPTVTS